MSKIQKVYTAIGMRVLKGLSLTLCVGFANSRLCYCDCKMENEPSLSLCEISYAFDAISEL